MDNNLIDALNYLDPNDLSYQEWIATGMALKREGFSLADWESWCQRDRRFKKGECAKKWDSFTDSQRPVRGGSLIKMATDRGWKPPERTFGFNDVIEYDGEIEELTPAEQNILFLETLFRPDDIIGYVTEFRDGNPTKGIYNRSCGEILESLEKHPEDLGATYGDNDRSCGALIHINPLNGNGVKNTDVSDYRYVLVECDDLALKEQERLLRESGIPIATLTYSGGKSLHAVVRINAENQNDYANRVETLFNYLQGCGIPVDTATKNAGRMTRLPGMLRKGKLQRLIGVNIGAKSYEEWLKSTGELPPFSYSCDHVHSLPPLEDELIAGVLRQGHKMLIAGPSKAGKSFLLMELSIALSEGGTWLGFKCKKSKVLYVNFEISARSCYHRIAKIYNELGIYSYERVLGIYNLRGKARAIDEMVPELISLIKREKFEVVVLDPLYKILGQRDENSAGDMALLCNQFDKIATETGASVIYCHHHSKGAQGGKKAQDRNSGSGVFARDPDALLDIIELNLTDDIKNFVAEPGETAWRMECSLREFAPFRPVNFWFRYPLHIVDETGTLERCYADGDPDAIFSEEAKKFKKESRRDQLLAAFDLLQCNGKTTINDMAGYFGVTGRSVRDWLKGNEDLFKIDRGTVSKTV